ncbi:hypothetical protein SynA15127_01035 [Synechococcus sp. A15-127]|nr:hypothetical protein SynA15127_01035 [Synechococcus sp. A15-127]
MDEPVPVAALQQLTSPTRPVAATFKSLIAIQQLLQHSITLHNRGLSSCLQLLA